MGLSRCDCDCDCVLGGPARKGGRERSSVACHDVTLVVTHTHPTFGTEHPSLDVDSVLLARVWCG